MKGWLVYLLGVVTLPVLAIIIAVISMNWDKLMTQLKGGNE